MPSAFANYASQPERYDEVFDVDGRPRSHWKRLAEAAARASRAELSRRAGIIRHAVEQDGVTYNIYADPKGADRPWEVDLLPLIISNRGVAPPGEGSTTARVPVKRCPCRPVRHGSPACRRVVATSDNSWSSQLSVALPRAGAAERYFPKSLWLRSRPLSRRPLVGHRRPHAGSLRRRLRGAKPAHRYAHVWTAVPLARRAAARWFLSHIATAVGSAGAHRW